MSYAYLLGLGEIALKGKNFNYFKSVLKRNVKIIAQRQGANIKIIDLWKRIIVESDKKIDLKYLFGIDFYANVIICKPELKEIESNIVNIVDSLKVKSFKIEAKRNDKTFFLNSLDLAKKIGKEVEKKTGVEAKLKDPDIRIYVNIYKEKALIYFNKLKAFGGLPTGSEGKVFVILGANEKKNSLTILEMAKRGAKVIPIKVKEIIEESSEFYEFVKNYLPYEIKAEEKKIENLNDSIVAMPISYEELSNMREKLEVLKKKFNITFLFPLLALDKKIDEMLEVYKNG